MGASGQEVVRAGPELACAGLSDDEVLQERSDPGDAGFLLIKEFILGYHSKETKLFTINPYDGTLYELNSLTRTQDAMASDDQDATLEQPKMKDPLVGGVETSLC